MVLKFNPFEQLARERDHVTTRILLYLLDCEATEFEPCLPQQKRYPVRKCEHNPETLKEGIDEGCNRRSLSQDNQGSKKYEHHDDRKEPEFLPLLHEGPEFHYKIAHTHLLLTSTASKLVFHMGMGPWRSEDPVGRTRLGKPLPHRIFPHETEHQANWSHQGIKYDAEQNPGVDPAQNMPDPHPPFMNGC